MRRRTQIRFSPGRIESELKGVAKQAKVMRRVSDERSKE
jgi:hypothetical protein